MDKFFYYFGVFNFFFYIFVSIWFLIIIFKDSVSEKIRLYKDECFLHNINMTGIEFDDWMKNVRSKMSDDEYRQWDRKHVKWYYSYLKVKKHEGKREKKK